MKQEKWREIIFNACIVLNCFLVFLLAFGSSLQLPALLQVVGRAHPLVLHFPIVLLLLSVVFEMIIANRKTTALTDVADWMLLSATLTTLAAALMGLFLSNEEGYDAGAIATHKWVGAACAIISVLWYACRVQLRRKKLATMITGFTCMTALLVTGHEGAGITHGQGFLLEPIKVETTKPAVWLEDAVIFTHLIKPILTEKCVSCHSSSKAKGDLILETQTLLLKGGKNGKLWDTTATGLGLMMERLHLPLASKEHMPPKGKPQLTEEEMKALYYWIKGGASFSKKVNELPANDSLKIIAQGFFKNVETEKYAFEPIDEATITQLNTTYRAVSAISYKSPALAVSFFGATFFKGEQLKELAKIKDNIVSLDLYKMPVTDQDLKTIATFSNLRKLNIAFTKINGEGLTNLRTLQNLQQLSISGTNIKLAHLKPLTSLKKLSAVYIWNTGITEAGQIALKKDFPHTHFNMGYKSDTVIAKLTRPVIEGDISVFSADLQVKFKKHIKGTIIRYTLDGTDPDSVKSPIYKDHVLIKQTGLLKAKAFLPGWISSDILAEYFYKSVYKPDSVKLLTPPNPSYKVNGALSLFDGERGSNSFITGQWLGFRENNFEALLYFKTPIELSAVTFGNLSDINSYLMPPKELQVWGGNSPSSLKLLGKINPAQPNKILPAAVTGFDCRFPKQQVKVVKLVGIPVNPLPKWHPGKGDRAWLFLDEVFLN